MKTKNNLEFEELGQALQQDYFEKARYLLDAGYIDKTYDFHEIAEHMYYKDRKKAREAETD